MVIRTLSTSSRDLTGQKRVRIGPLGILCGEVQIKKNDDLLWVRVEGQYEWDWCNQLEQEDSSTK